MKDTHSNSHRNPILVTFDTQAEPLEWNSLGDQVMGGQSDGKLVNSAEGVGLFHGTVRLDNGGGFACLLLQIFRRSKKHDKIGHGECGRRRNQSPSKCLEDAANGTNSK